MAKKQRKRRRRPREPEYQSYIFRIEDWEPSYMFALNRSRHFEGPYWEHLDLSLEGVFLSPDKAKDRRASLKLPADRRQTHAVTDPESCDWKPLFPAEAGVIFAPDPGMIFSPICINC